MKELHIRLSEQQPGAYQAEIVDPLTGAESFERPTGADWPCPLALPPFPGGYRTFGDFQRHLLSLKPNDPNDLEAIGSYLYNFLFGPENKRNALYDYWTGCLNQSQEVQVEGIRTVLQLDSPSLIGVPWELCNENGDYLAVNIPHTLLRTAWTASGAFKKEPVPLDCKTQAPLRVLLIISHKEQDMAVKGPDEALSVDAALFKLLPWMVDLHILIRPTIAEVREWCESWEPHILHFVGHGGATAEGSPYLLLYESGQTDATRIDQNAFINLFKAKVPRLVVLNACRSGQVSNVDANMAAAQAIQSFSKRLIEKGVLAVIAMQADIEGADAVALMQMFYHKLAKGKAIDQAVTFARDHRFAQASLSPNEKWDWALPALYLAKDIRAEKVLCVDASKAESMVIPPIDHNQDWLPLSLGVKIHVGREKEQLTLEKTILTPDLSHIPPVTLLHGVQDMGKSTMLYWLSEGCERRGRAFIYADFGRTSLNYWDALRLIRNGWLETVDGVKLANHLDSDLFFNTFNDALNRKTLPNYATEYPKKPDETTPVKDKAPDKNPTVEMGNQGTLRSDENPFETITNEFRSGLIRISGSNGLIIFLDHIEMLIPDTVERIRTYLIEPLVAAGSDSPLSNIRLVLAIRDIDPAEAFLLGQSTSGKAWNFLFELAQKNGSPLRKLQFEGLPYERLQWLAQIWGRRYFLSCSGATVFKQYLQYFLNGRDLQPEQVDAYVKRRVDSYGPVAKAPGELIRHLLEETYIRDWLKTL